MSELNNIALQIISNGKGILAADESTVTMTKRLESVGVESSAKNRLSFNFKTKYYDFKFGDSYPNFSEYSIKGARLRGNNIIFQNNFLYLNILTGNLLRATQGLPDEAIKLISKIEQALKRIKDGTYGYCEETGEPIGIKRLIARPIATLCIAAQEKHEKEEKVYADL